MFEGTGLDWDEVSREMVDKGWAEQVSPTEVRLKKDLDIDTIFSDKFSGDQWDAIKNIMQQSANSGALTIDARRLLDLIGPNSNNQYYRGVAKELIIENKLYYGDSPGIISELEQALNTYRSTGFKSLINRRAYFMKADTLAVVTTLFSLAAFAAKPQYLFRSKEKLQEQAQYSRMAWWALEGKEYLSGIINMWLLVSFEIDGLVKVGHIMGGPVSTFVDAFEGRGANGHFSAMQAGYFFAPPVVQAAERQQPPSRPEQKQPQAAVKLIQQPSEKKAPEGPTAAQENHVQDTFAADRVKVAVPPPLSPEGQRDFETRQQMLNALEAKLKDLEKLQQGGYHLPPDQLAYRQSTCLYCRFR
jgi:hypothetical protein